MANKEVKEEKNILNGSATWQLLADGTSKIVWGEGVSLPQILPNKKVS